MRQRVIIFDGPDRCGKSEMARELSARLQIPYFKNEAEWEAFSNDPQYFQNAMKYGDDFFYRFLKDTGISCVLDRSYPSEWVYSKVYNRKTYNDSLERIDSIASSIGVKIVVPFRSSYDGIYDEVHDIDSEHLAKLDLMYLEFLKWTKCSSLHLNVDDEKLDREMDDIINFLEAN